MGSIQTDGLDSNGNQATYSQTFTRVRSADASQALQGEYVIHPTGDIRYVLGGGLGAARGGIWANDAAGVLQAQGPGTINLAAIYQNNRRLWQEGDYSPVLLNTTPGTTYAVQTGTWSLDGNRLKVFFRLHVTAAGAVCNGNVQISLPPGVVERTAAFGYYGELSQYDNVTLSPGFNVIKGKIAGGRIHLTQMSPAGGNAAYLPCSALTNNSNFEGMADLLTD
jgi:hypothetical protein